MTRSTLPTLSLALGIALLAQSCGSDQDEPRALDHTVNGAGTGGRGGQTGGMGGTGGTGGTGTPGGTGGAYDPCKDVTCSGHGACTSENGLTACDCDDGYRVVGFACVSESVEPSCSTVQIECVQDRGPAFDVCCVETVCEYVFDDGKAFVGTSAALGYCLGKTDGTEDGTCTGTATPCSDATSEAACSQLTSCSWDPDFSECDGSRTCNVHYESASCNAVAGCAWQGP